MKVVVDLQFWHFFEAACLIMISEHSKVPYLTNMTLFLEA